MIPNNINDPKKTKRNPNHIEKSILVVQAKAVSISVIPMVIMAATMTIFGSLTAAQEYDTITDSQNTNENSKM